MYTQRINKNTLQKEYSISKATLIFALIQHYLLYFFLFFFHETFSLHPIFWSKQYSAVEYGEW